MSEQHPPHFSRYTLAELAAPGSDTFVDGPFGSSLKSNEYVSSGVRLIQLQNIGIGEWRDENRKFITAQKFKTLERHGAIPGDIAIAKMADPVARACLVPEVSGQFVVVADCIRLRLDETRFDPRFVVRAINGPYTRREAERKAIGSTRIRINLGGLKTVSCLAPGLTEQRAISSVLDTLDTAIHETEAIIAKLKAVQRGLLHDLLTRGIDANGELRPPQTEAPHRYKESSLGWIPIEWELTSLSALGVGGLINGVFKEPSRVGKGVPLVNVADLYRGESIAVAECERFAATDPEVSRYSARQGDIFFTRSSLNLEGIAQTSFLAQEVDRAVFECHVMRLRPNPTEVVPRFLKEWCVGRHARKHFMANAKQVTMTTISQDGIAGLTCPKPSIDEQTEAVRRMSAIDDRLNSEASIVRKLQGQKAALMDDLLTGRVRVTPLLDTATL